MSRKKTIFFPAANIRQKSWRQQWSFIIYFNYFFCDVSSKCYGTPKVCILCYICQLLVYIFWFHEFMNFRSSTPQSDTDLSDDDEDDDVSDHDLTPCKICLYIFFVFITCLFTKFFDFRQSFAKYARIQLGTWKNPGSRWYRRRFVFYCTPSIIFFRQLFIFAIFIIWEILYLFYFFQVGEIMYKKSMMKPIIKLFWWVLFLLANFLTN